MEDRMLTVAEVAQRLRISIRQVRYYIERNELIAFRVGKRGYRIAESDLAEFVARRKRPP